MNREAIQIAIRELKKWQALQESDGARSPKWDFTEWRSDGDCGTVCCAGGFLETNPEILKLATKEGMLNPQGEADLAWLLDIGTIYSGDFDRIFFTGRRLQDTTLADVIDDLEQLLEREE